MKKSPPSIDWQRALGKLTYSATRWMVGKRGVDRDDPIIKGRSPGDLAQEALIEVIEKYGKLAKTGTDEELLGLAYRIMYRDFLDLVRSKEYRGRERLDDPTLGLEESLSSVETQYQELEDADLISELYAIAADDGELKDFIDAVVELNLYKREHVAEILDVSPQEVTNRQRRLGYQYLKKQRKEEKAASR